MIMYVPLFSSLRKTNGKLNEQSHNPLALVEDVAPKVKKTAKEVIANTTKENADKWIQDQSEDEDTPPPDPVSEVKDEVMEEVAIAEAREEGVIENPPTQTLSEPSLLKQDDDDDDLEEIAPPPRSIRLRVNKPVIKPEIESVAGTSRPRRAKRKAPTPEEEEDVEIPPPRKGRSIKIKSTPTSAPTPTRSLRSRAPKTEEKQAADRVARARIRAALSEDVDMEDEEDVDMDM